jgi:signal transduction histidine kinase
MSGDVIRRRNLYFVLLAGALAILGFGAYATTRVVRRELEIARMKSDFVSAVSHEFRSPLTGIRQLGEMLMRGRVPSEERRQEYYARITSESDRLARVIENLLDFARMEEGKKPYAFEPLKTSAWLSAVATAFEAHASSNGHRLVTGIPAELPSLVADRDALSTAVDNLLDNAVKYSPETDTVWLDAEAGGGFVTIRVRDRGPGIADVDRSRIFERFYRGGGELTRRVKGTGLGLSLVAHIVRSHGGQVSVQSAPGSGSTFTIVLPLPPS